MNSSAKPLVSIIIRTKNEERWIHSCLKAVFKQEYNNFEVIVVDNNSTDTTLRRIEEFPVKVITIKDFFPGKAINEGIKSSKGKIIVCLSGHGIPVTSNWLEKLVFELKDSQVAGVYGRQEPLSFSSDFDKRDLITVFGLDKKIQKKDTFFHNANSAFRREIWDAYPFNEKISNIEDRVWGKEVISKGFKIIYEPEASIYHWHGIHHNLNPQRASNVVKILESIDELSSKNNYQDPSSQNIIAIIPIRGQTPSVNNTCLLDYTIRSAKNSKFLKEIIVSTDNEETAKMATKLGAKTPLLRPKELSEEFVDITEVLKFSLEQIEESRKIPDLVIILEETYPFRPINLLDRMIERFLLEGMDTLIAAKKESRSVWVEKENKIELISDGFGPRKFKENKTLVSMLGLASITRPEIIRIGDLRLGKIGIFEINEPLANIEIRDATTLNMASEIIDIWWKKQNINKS